MIEFLKIVGAALVASATTLLSLYLQRKWKKEDVREEKDDAVIGRLDNLADSLKELSASIDRLERRQDIEESTSAALQSGLREILYDRIKELSMNYEQQGRIREEEYNSIKRMWNVYHTQLGGNGFLDSRMEIIEGLDKY